MPKKKMVKQKEEELKEKKRLRDRAREKAAMLKSETFKAMSTAIVAAFGFLMALAWRDVITEYVNSISYASPVQGHLVSALIITFISVIGIMIVTSLLMKREWK